MEKKELNVRKFETIHSEVGYKLVTIVEVFIPWFKCTVKCKCEKEQPMSELDKIFCMCIDRGINNIKDISFVLSLDSEIALGEIERLIQGKILRQEEDEFFFTEFGRDSFLRKTRLNIEVKEFPVYVNSITGEWTTQEENYIFKKAVTSSGIKLSPLKTVIKEDVENNDYIRKSLAKLHETNIIKLQLLDYKVIEYCKEDILFYQNDKEKVLFEIYDECKCELDINLSATLRKRYEKREILELMKAEYHLKIAKNALLKSVKEIHPKTDIKPSTSSLRYVRNQEIRELFLKEMNEAKKHLFIISPWITDFVVDEEMVDKFENTLKRGVRIDIGFGYVSMDKMKWKIKKYETDDGNAYSEKEKKKIEEQKLKDKEIQSWKMAQMLKERLGQYNTFRIFYVREGTHEKIFCYDDENILVGSYNLLSYDGGEQENYSGFKFRYEGGALIEDEKFAAEVMQDFESSIEEL